MSYYSEQYSQLTFPISTDNSPGLRNAQIGALYAVASHATLRPLDPAIVVMPTGSGKTAVLMMAPYMLRKTKVLIVTPSALVRGQIAEEFKTLKTLKKIGVFDKSVASPNVYEAIHLYSDECAEKIELSEVVIASHQVAASISENNIKFLFDYVIIDEAHHVPAPTWQRIIHNMNHSASLLVTATPFRKDRKEIKGDHVYNYPLSKAYRDGIFGPISFIPIDEAPNKDYLISKEAERVLLNDRSEGYDHYLFVRTDTKEKAKELESLYRAETSLRLKRIDSSMSYRTIKRTIKALKEKELDGIICVDMLGEGFDFPNLKIAAIHEPHKSLAATLQFVGRFARTNAEQIGTAKFIAMNDEELRIENRKLYTADAVWQDMIIEMSEAKINDDIENSQALKDFTRPDNELETISLHSIRPNCHARVYRVTAFDFNSSFPDSLDVQNNIFKSEDSNTIVGIAVHNEAPLWLEGNVAMNTEYNLFIVHYQTETNLLFIYSQQKSERIYDAIAESFCSEYQKIPRNEMNRVLAGFNIYEFFNTGMQNRYAETGESYRIYAGSNTAASIDETTGRMLSAGHAFCKVIQENGMGATIGFSSGSKFWSSSYLPIPEYVNWCDSLGKKIVNSSITVKTNTNYDNLPIPYGIETYSEDVLFAFFSEKTFLSPPSLRVDGEDEILGLLTDAELKVKEITENGKYVNFQLNIGNHTTMYSCDTAGRYYSSTDEIVCRDGVHKIKLSDYFNDHPLIFKTADDTVYTGNEVLRGNYSLEKFDQGRIISLDWEKYNTDISVEAGELSSGKHTVQEAVEEYLKENEQYSHIVFDHGSGEIADFITFCESDSEISVELYHCKAMKGSNYNSSVEDVYEVSQQAVKSVIWLKSRMFLLERIQKRVKGGKTNKFIKGDIRSLNEILHRRKLLVATIYIVQPAISASSEMPDKIGTVLSSAAFFIKNTGRAKAVKVIGSK